MMVWSIANQKGGVGKTTTAVTLAGVLINRGYKPLLIDLDPHGSMTSYFKLDPDNQEDSVYQVFKKGGGAHGVPLASLLHKTEFNGLTLLPASTALATLDRQLAGRDGMGLVLARMLRQCEHQFTHVLIDCPPIMGVLMVNALAACENLIIPVQTEFLALKGLERMLRTLKMVLQARKSLLNYVIIPTLYDRRTRASKDTMKALQERHAQHLWKGLVPVDTRFREASRVGKPLSVMHPGARGSRAYQKFLDFLLDGASLRTTA